MSPIICAHTLCAITYELFQMCIRVLPSSVDASALLQGQRTKRTVNGRDKNVAEVKTQNVKPEIKAIFAGKAMEL